MRQLTIALIITLFSIGLASCKSYRYDVQQGNIITPGMVGSIHKGMTVLQVEKTLGTPILTNLYKDNRLVYLYTMQPGHGHYQQRKLVIYFRNGRVTGKSSSLDKLVLPTK